MNPRELLNAMHVAESLKNATRHCYTSCARHESVAEHSWRMALMAYFLKDEFPQADMNKVIAMCLIHDLGEAFTGDIPTFVKTSQDEQTEDRLLDEWVRSLPEKQAAEMKALYAEMAQRKTLEAKICKALDISIVNYQNSALINEKTIGVLSRYNMLDEKGAHAVRTVLEIESARCAGKPFSTEFIETGK